MVKDQKLIPFQLELQWCFDFRPANAVLDSLELTVMQNDPNSFIFNSSNAIVDSITWYVHAGLTENIINCCYESENDNSKEDIVGADVGDSVDHGRDSTTNGYKFYQVKKVKYLDGEKVHGQTIPNIDEIKNRLSFQKFQKNIHFNGVPVVDMDVRKNNAFLWQKIPENSEYSTFIDILVQGVNEEDRYLSLTKFNRVNLTKSVRNQYGFVLKAVIKGKKETKNSFK